MTRAFGGTATTAPEGTTDYMLGPSLREKWDDPRRVAMVEWMAKVPQEKWEGVFHVFRFCSWWLLIGLGLFKCF